MRASQRALLTALGVVVAIMIVSVIWVRLHVSPAVQLSGQRTTLTPALTDFDELAVTGTWQLTLQQGESWSVELDVPLELQDRVEARIDGGRLRLGVEGEVFGGPFGRGDMIAKITMPQLDALQVSGAGDVDFTGFMGERLELTLSGATDIDGRDGRFAALALTLSGSGDVDLRGVPVTDAEVSVSGSSDVTLTMAGGRLTGHLSGAGDLTYYGTAREQSVTTSGAADVRHID